MAKRTEYSKAKERALERIRRMYLYLETEDVDASERLELELKIRKLADYYGLQTYLRSKNII